MATNIVQMTDGTGNKQYPVTSAEAVGMPDGSGNLTNYLDKRVTEYNVSVLHPTSGSGGSNKYTLETAIAQVPSKYRSVGIKCAFINEDGESECWEYKVGSWNVNGFVQVGSAKLTELDNNIVALKSGLGNFLLFGKRIKSSNYAPATLGYKSGVTGKIVKLLLTTNLSTFTIFTSGGVKQTFNSNIGYNEFDVDIEINEGDIVAASGLSFINENNGSYNLNGDLQGFSVDLRFVVLVGSEKYVSLEKYKEEVTPLVEKVPTELSNINTYINGTSSLLGSYFLYGKKIESDKYAAENLGYKSELSGTIVKLIFKTSKDSISVYVADKSYKLSTKIGDNIIDVNIPVNKGDIVSLPYLAYIDEQNGSYNNTGTLRPYVVDLQFIVRTGDLSIITKEQYSEEITPIIGEYTICGKSIEGEEYAPLILGYKSDITGYVRQLHFTTNTPSDNKLIYIAGKEYYIGKVVAGENIIDVNIPISEGDVLATSMLTFLRSGSSFDKDGNPQGFEVDLKFKVYEDGKFGDIIKIKDRIDNQNSNIQKNSYNILRGCLISVLGDSISTFEGVTDGYPTHYPSGTVEQPGDTYWGMLADILGGTINVNAAYGGSAVTNTRVNPPFITRAEKLGNPDIILLHGGTNDGLAELGEYDYSDVEDESAEFRPAYARLINKLQKTYPYSFIIAIIPEYVGNGYAESERVICQHYGVQYVDMSDPEKEETVVDHPNKEGMEKICNAILKSIDFSSMLRKVFWHGSKSFTKEARPRSIGCQVGESIFDSTLGKPIWYKGDQQWVDATGEIVENPSGYR